ncbi:hypothetical protein JI76_37510 [Streptomyces anulatus]|nr:hypothetical protein JI76_37510 [Streptomyces anulatus]KQX26856.1 hypothetical protein ASD29_31105 [Streptomyces sp. Root1295]KRA46046.1 hypothetical protein ASD97_38220 [Streptomyces sp. Root63]
MALRALAYRLHEAFVVLPPHISRQRQRTRPLPARITPGRMHLKVVRFPFADRFAWCLGLARTGISRRTTPQLQQFTDRQRERSR